MHLRTAANADGRPGFRVVALRWQKVSRKNILVIRWIAAYAYHHSPRPYPLRSLSLL